MDTNYYHSYIDVPSIGVDVTEDSDAYKILPTCRTQLDECSKTKLDSQGSSLLSPVDIAKETTTESPVPTYDVPKILTVKKYRLYKKG